MFLPAIYSPALLSKCYKLSSQ